MLSSPPQPTSPDTRRRDFLFYDFGRTNTTRKRTLEWACAASRVTGKLPEEDEEEGKGEIGDLTLPDLGGDTETEDDEMVMTSDSSMEVLTPKGKIQSAGERREDKEKSRGKKGKENMKVEKNVPVVLHDEEMMDAALVLCGMQVGRR